MSVDLENISGAIESQLYRYYDVEFMILLINIKHQDCSEYTLELYGFQEGHLMPTQLLVKARLLNENRVEDLFLHDGIDFIGPTTNLEEQEQR